jgi:glycosyltransferase involved in cell wall biosynthesis
MISFGPVESKSNGYFIRSYHIAKSLAELHHKVLVLEFPEDNSSTSVESETGITFVHLKGNEVSQNRITRILRNVFSFDPLTIIRFQLRSLLELIRYRDYLNACDFVFIEGALIPSGIILTKLLKKAVVLDTHCVNKILALNFRNRNRLVYLTRTVLWDLLERFATRHSTLIIVVSTKEQLFVQREYSIRESRIFVVPNVIDTPKPIQKEKLLTLQKDLNIENKTLVTFVGNLTSIQNRDAVEYVINILAPFFWQKRRDVLFLIVGKGKEAFKHYPPNVLFLGFVEEVTPYLAFSDICIAPLRVGSGVKTKVLEYMAYGRSIVTTPIGIEGLEEYVDLFPVQITSVEDFKDTLLAEIVKKRTEKRPDVSNIFITLHNIFEDRLEDIITHIHKLSKRVEPTLQQLNRY